MLLEEKSEGPFQADHKGKAADEQNLQIFNKFTFNENLEHKTVTFRVNFLNYENYVFFTFLNSPFGILHSRRLGSTRMCCRLLLY